MQRAHTNPFAETSPSQALLAIVDRVEPTPLPSPEHTVLLLVGGFIAGGVNTFAGGGSFLTVPLLILAGLPPTVANATNRVAVVFQNLAALEGFRREGVGGLRVAVAVLPATLAGSWIGAYFATSVSDALFQQLFGAMMLLALPVLLWSPSPSQNLTPRVQSPLHHALFFAMGLYGGAIQAGVGIPLLLACVGLGGLDLVRANQVKVALVCALSVIALAQFIYVGKIFWSYGLILALGTSAGAYSASRFGTQIGPRLIRWVLAISIVALALHLLWRGGSA